MDEEGRKVSEDKRLPGGADDGRDAGSDGGSGDGGRGDRTGGGPEVTVQGATVGYQIIASNLVLHAGAQAPPPGSADDSGPESGGAARASRRSEDGDRRDGSKYRFVDPTIPWERLGGAPAFRFDESEVAAWSGRLETHRVVGIRCAYDSVGSAAVHSLLERDGWSGYQRRLLAFGKDNEGREDLFFENLAGQRFGDRELPTLVVVETHGMPAFVDTMMVSGESWAHSLSASLQVEKLAFVVHVAARQSRSFAGRFSEFPFPCWTVDFLRPLLRKHFPQEQAGELVDRILRQRERGHWGPSDDDLHLFEAIAPLVAPDPSRLLEVLDDHDQSVAVASGPSAVAAFESRLPVYQAVVTAAAFFRDLDVNEFAQTVFALVGEERVLVPEPELAHGDKPLVRKRERRLEEAWPRIADELLEECGLAVRSTGGQSTVDFARAGERAAVQSRIRNSVYFSNVGEGLWKAGHLFDPGASPELVEGAVTVFVEVLSHRKDWRRPEWLSQTLIERMTRGESQDVLEALRRFARDSLVISRLAQLLRALIAGEVHRELVQGWLAHLLARRGHLPVLALAMHLRATEGFDYLHWLKRLSDESPDEIRNEAYGALLRHARQSSVRIWDFFAELESWLPEPERPPIALSNSNNFALQLVVDYTIDSAEAVPLGEYGEWPSRYPLFRNLPEDPAASTERLSSLVAWLFHPGIRAIFRQEPDASAWAVRAWLLELWSWLLLGLGDAQTHAEAEAVYRRLLELYWEHTDRDGRNRLVTGWRGHRERLQAERRASSRQRADLLSRQIEVSVRLERDFKQLSESRSRRAAAAAS